ncbi:unnamed protein product [Nippostrongylus brasiliensis]|uniref:Leucine-rich repeat domain-containing protein n=1 Tax=Nippostrongylus brasiliensis TaxID=27835 RepID=A0A0N4XHR9_NIPBR|nr:unnamed protein product [Nippostrongylus brasiliensis]
MSRRSAVSIELSLLQTMTIFSGEQEIGATRIDRLRVSGCAQPMLDVLPEGPVRSLVLTNCQIADIDPKVSRVPGSMSAVDPIRPSFSRRPFEFFALYCFFSFSPRHSDRIEVRSRRFHQLIH